MLPEMLVQTLWCSLSVRKLNAAHSCTVKILRFAYACRSLDADVHGKIFGMIAYRNIGIDLLHTTYFRKPLAIQVRCT